LEPKRSVALISFSVVVQSDRQKKENGISFDDVLKAFLDKKIELPMSLEPEKFSPSRDELPTPQQKGKSTQHSLIFYYLFLSSLYY
jgi:hypothetical protein